MATIGERFVQWLGGATQADIDERVSRSYEAGFYDGNDGNDDPQSGTTAEGGLGYRDASAGQGAQAAISPDEAYRIAWTLWQSNPVAKRITKIKRDYIIKRGVRPTATDEALQGILNDLWERNKMGVRASEFAMQLFALGEQCFPAFVRDSDGRVTLAYFGPDQIETVIADPDNAMEFYAVVLKAQSSGKHEWVKSYGQRVYRIVRKADGGDNDGRLLTAKQTEAAKLIAPWEIAMLKQYGLTEYSGDVLFYRVNAVSNQARGQSDLLPLADWLDQEDETLFALAEREQFAGYFSHDVKLTGADPAKVLARAAELRKSGPPKKGSINLHNDQEEWTLNSADIGQSGSIDSYKALLTHILGGAGFPQSWYGYGDETNRATAQAQADPTRRSLEHEQGIVHDMLMGFCLFARDQAIISGAYSAKEIAAMLEAEIDIPMPEMTTRDIGRIAAALTSLVSALMIAVEVGLMPPEHAVAVLYKAVDELGLELEQPEAGDLEIPDEQPGEESPGELANVEAWRRALARMPVFEVE